MFVALCSSPASASSVATSAAANRKRIVEMTSAAMEGVSFERLPASSESALMYSLTPAIFNACCSAVSPSPPAGTAAGAGATVAFCSTTVVAESIAFATLAAAPSSLTRYAKAIIAKPPAAQTMETT